MALSVTYTGATRCNGIGGLGKAGRRLHGTGTWPPRQPGSSSNTQSCSTPLAQQGGYYRRLRAGQGPQRDAGRFSLSGRPYTRDTPSARTAVRGLQRFMHRSKHAAGRHGTDTGSRTLGQSPVKSGSGFVYVHPETQHNTTRVPTHSHVKTQGCLTRCDGTQTKTEARQAQEY